VASVVLVGAPACGKTAIWLGLAAALGAAALRLQDASGAAAERLPWPVAHARFGHERCAHGVRVAHLMLGGRRRQPWPLHVRLVDGPGIDADDRQGGTEVARLLRESVAADLLVHVVSDCGDVDGALAQLAASRRIALERVVVVAPGRRPPDGALRVRLGAAGAVRADASALATWVRRRLAAGGARNAAPLPARPPA
jgi:hypothetical protein